VERAANGTATYLWSCNPPSLGQITTPTGQATVFKAGTVNRDTPVKISVSITPEKGQATVSSLTVTIKNLPVAGTPPIASAEVDQDMIKPGHSVQLTDTSTDSDGTIAKVEWDFSYDVASGFQVDSSAKAPIATYPEIGEYLIQLRVTDSTGLTDLLDTPITITVTNDYFKPVAKAAFSPETADACQPVQFRNDGSYPRDGTSLTMFEWDWNNDGTFDEAAEQATHTWDTSGTYQVQFRVTDNNGASGVLSTPLSVTVTSPAPVASAVVKPQAEYKVGRNIGFDATSSHSVECGGNIVNYEWDWQNDGTFDDSGSTINRYFDYPGHKTIQMRVTDDRGASATLDSPIQIDVAPGNSFVWGGNGHDSAGGVAIDPSGNIYVTGHFNGTADFDPDIAVTNVSTQAGASAYLSKMDSTGHLIWVKTWGTSGEQAGYDITISHDGFIYVAGTTTLIKFNAQGDFVWTYNSVETGQSVAVDDHNGIFITGKVLPPYQTLPDAYLACLNYDGTLKWEKFWGSTGNDSSNDVALDSAGDVYVTGHFDGTVDLDPGPMTDIHVSEYDDDTDSFISRFHPDGIYVWGKSWGSTDAYALAIGNGSQLYVTGYYEGTTNFDPDYDGFHLYGAVGTYVSCFAISGTHTWTCGWASTYTNSSNFDPGYSIAIGPDGSVYISGAFETTTDFDPYYYGHDVHEGGGAYITRLRSDGWYIGCYTWGSYTSAAWDNAWDVAINNEGNPVVVGNYHDVCNFNIQGDEYRTTRGDHDAFLLTFPADVEW